MTRIELARSVATFMHGSQKYGEKPYTVHLEEVAEIASPWGEDAIVIAYLHDAIEDTDLHGNTIGNLFGSRVQLCVEAVTDAPGANRKERNALTYEKLAGIDEKSDLALALVVKAADRLANVRACLRAGNDSLLEMYRQEHPAFVKAVRRVGLNENLTACVTLLLPIGGSNE